MKLKLIADGERKAISRQLIDRHGLAGKLANNADLLLEEFDAFLSGRGVTKLEEYLEIDRRGGGSPLARADRARVFAAYQDYLERLEKRGETDHHLVRLKALELAEAGYGPRFAGVVVDEAQDLTEVGIKLLIALDESENHRRMMIVGDGQQSIYPGGFSLRSIGLDVRGRSRVLTSNWRNTWSIWTAAKAIVGDEDFDDLDDEVGLRPTGEEPAPLTVGEPTVLHVLKTPGEEMELLATIVGERVEAGVDPGDIAVLVDARPWDIEELLRAEGLPTVPLDKYAGEHAQGVLVGTLNRAKGLEFKEVIIPGLSAAERPPRWLVPADLPEEQRAERLALVRRRLFVGMTRARDRLQLLSGGAPAADIERARWAMDVREY